MTRPHTPLPWVLWAALLFASLLVNAGLLVALMVRA
jgi:hypothetical protein